MGIRKWFLAAGVACLGLVGQVSADVKLPKVFSDHMVLQRDREVPFWGWGKSGDKIEINASWGKTVITTVGINGTWKANTPLTKAYQGSMRNSKVKLKFSHVKSHSGDIFNEMADDLAKRGTELTEITMQIGN